MAKFKPYAARISYAQMFPHAIVAREAFEGYMVVYERPAMPELGPLGMGVCCLWHHKSRFEGPASIAVDENTTLQVAIARIKKAMLLHGAVAEAVELIGELSPFTKKELELMADKLKTKGAAKADTAADKPAKGKGAAAAKAPAAKGKGNPEALKKAQEASAGKRAEARAKKLKVSLKAKDITAREGTFRHQMLVDLIGMNGKTVGDFYDANEKYDAGCLRFATEAGFVTVS